MTQSRSIALHGTDQNYYVTNLETGKIELHFDYQTYKDLEQDLKKEIKRYFLWSRGKQAWISKAKEMTYGIQQIIAKTDLTDNGTIGEKISFEEQISRKVSRAENKISRLQDRKEKSKKRQEQFQSEANRFSGDISFWTQPNINSGKGRSFTNYRNRVIARYEKGLKEHAYREYLDNKIGAAISTANQRQLKDVGFLNRRIAENEKRYRKLKKSLDDTEKLLQQGNLSEEKKEQIQKNVNWWSGNLQEVIDKLNFYKLKIEEAGGVLYSKESVKDWAAYVNYRGAWYPIKSFNTKTITFLNWHRIAKFEWKTPYAEIKPGALKKIGEITVLDRDGNEVLPKVNLKPKVEKSQSEKTKPEEEKETEETNPQQKTDTSLEIIDYSEKSIALKGTDLEMGINKDFLWEKFNLWGTFNVRLKDQNGKKFSGWIFKKTDQEKVKELVKFLEAGNKGDGKKRERSHSKKGREKHVKSLVSIDQHVVFLAWKKADDYDNQRKSYIHNPSFKTYLDDKHNLYIVSKYTQIDPWTGSEGKEVTGTLLVSKGGKTERLYDNDKKPDLKKFREIQIPLFIKVPREKKKPHYKLAREAKEKINRKILLKEIVFGKMEVAIKKVWNGYEDYYEYLSSEKMNWYDPMSDEKDNSFFSETIDTFFYNVRHRSPYLSGEGIILLDNYQIRYRAGGIKQKVKSRSKALSKDQVAQVVSTLKEKAEKLRERAEAKMSSGTWSQNWTSRRGRIMDGLEKDADRLKAKAEIFGALAKGWENDSLPEILKGIRNETEIDAIFRGNGKYNPYPKITNNTAEWARKEIEAIKRRLEKIGITNEDTYYAAVEALKTIAHTEISTEDKKKRELRELENKWRNIKEKGFFPTPKTLAKRLVEEAGIQPGEIVLEPSAGLGHIAEVIRELHPENDLQVIERMVSLEQILLLKGFILVGNDFLLYTPEAGKAPDKIIMNPPFENNQDIAHLQHAYSILKPGGRVVAIIGEGAFFRQGKKETAFRDWLHQIDGVEEPLPENSFKGAEAFKQTGVRSRLVIIDKPGAEKEDDLSLALALQKQRIRILKLKAKLKSGLGNINDDVKLKLQLQKQRIRLLKLKSKKSNAQTKVQAVPLSKIHVNKKLFQNRETDYSHESVQRILEAVESGNFRWEVFDPVLLWKSPAGKLYILSGHSRTQAFKELVKKRKKVGGKSFKSIPAKIIQVSETEAKRIALESNTLSTKETDTERANYYRSLRNQKKSKKEVVELAQKNEGKNWKKIFNLSYLNPEGFLIDSIKATENSDVQSKSVVNTIADWIGELRVRFPELTDSHEKEIADWLMGDAYGNKTGQISNKRMFLEKLESAIYKITEFGKIPPGKRLNLKKTVSKSPVEQDYERQVEALKREKKKAMDVLKEKTEKLLKGAHEGKITKKKAQELLEPYQDNYMGLFNKLNKLLGKKYDIAQAAKQQTSLFGLGKFLIQNKKELLKAPI